MATIATKRKTDAAHRGTERALKKLSKTVDYWVGRLGNTIGYITKRRGAVVIGDLFYRARVNADQLTQRLKTTGLPRRFAPRNDRHCERSEAIQKSAYQLTQRFFTPRHKRDAINRAPTIRINDQRVPTRIN